ISGAASYGRSQNQSVKPVLTKAGQTSADGQRQVLQTPQPYANPKGAAQLATGRIDNKKIGEFFERPAPVNAKPESIGTRIGVASAAKTSADMMAAVGYAPTATMSNAPIISGRTLQNRSQVVGGGSQPKASGGNGQNTRRGNQSVPATETGSRAGD